MSVAVRSSASVVNGTAGTSVVVSKPTGTTNGDFLVAFIAEAAVATITAPAGWSLIGSLDAATGLRFACYRKVAASEGASWTWTLGSSARNWGSVHALTGVDTSNPIASSASDADTGGGFGGLGNDPISNFPRHGLMLTGLAATLTAPGVATTWTPYTNTPYDADHQTELVDVSTNAGSGTDITGTVLAYTAPDFVRTDDGWMQASVTAQTLTNGVGWTLGINPAESVYSGGLISGLTVEAAFGADPLGDPASWVWTDVTADLLADVGVRITKGRSDPASNAAPTRVQLTMRNFNGQWTPENPMGAHYPYIDIYLPLRVTVPYGRGGSSRRATVFVDSYAPSWDDKARVALIDINASGRLRRIQNGTRQARSAIYQTFIGVTPGDYVPAAYWPMEEGPYATKFASAILGPKDVNPGGTVQFGENVDLPSSEPLPTFGTDTRALFTIPSYTDTGQWVVQFVAKVPSEPAAETTICELRAAGSARRVKYSVLPGTPTKLRTVTYDSTNTQIAEGFNPLDGASFNAITEDQFYGAWLLHSLSLANLGGGWYLWQGMTRDATAYGVGGTAAGASGGALNSIMLFGSSGIAFGHLVVYTDPAFNIVGDAAANAAGFAAHVGEQTLDRFARMATEQSEPWTLAESLFSTPATDLLMGNQARGTFAGILRDVEAVDSGGIIHDGGPNGELVFATRRMRYNHPVDLTIDMARGQLATGFQPVFDDRRRVDDVTVTRDGGADGRAIATPTRGLATSPTLNLYDDDQPAIVAGWRLNLGTARGFRYPQIRMNLRRSPELTSAWLECQIGSRVAVTHLPSQHPSTTDADVFIEGYSEVITKETWEIALNVSPASPYTVGVLDDTVIGKLDTAGCTLHATWNGSSASFTVDTSSGPLWTTSPGQYPFDLNIGGQRVTVSGCSGSSNPQTFTVSVASVNGVSKSHSAGEAVSLWQPIVLAL